MGVRLALVILLAAAEAHAAPAVLELEQPEDYEVRVTLDGKSLAVTARAGTVQATLPGAGMRRLAIHYTLGDKAWTHEVLVALGPDVRLVAMPTWGVRIVSQDAGKRCGAVRGHRGPWNLCDGRTPLSTTKPFALDCPAPAAMASEHYYVIDAGDSIIGPSFLPTLPGLYRATYANGKLTVGHERHDCAGT